MSWMWMHNAVRSAQKLGSPGFEYLTPQVGLRWRLGVTSPTCRKGIGMISRAVASKPGIAAAVAAITLTLMVPQTGSQPSGDLQIGAFEAARTSTSAPAARPKPKFAQAPAQANAGSSLQVDSNPTLAEEAPHITPVTPGVPTRAQPGRAPMPAPDQASAPEDAPHIVPVMPEAPGTAMQVPPE